MRILVTGGAGYIGSHTVVVLQDAGHEVVIVDDLSNSSASAVDRIAEIAGKVPELHQVDLCDRDALFEVFSRTRPEAIVHFAALKAVGESVAQPLRYYRNNLIGGLNLFEAMGEHDCRTLVFSSSCTVYGGAPALPLREGAPTWAVSPYGWTKVMLEQILTDLHAADGRWRIGSLRYFNPVGAHPSGRLGEDPRGMPNNLLPFITQVAVGRRERLTVFGADYPTPDGTCVRDYIHVVDLAEGHLAALRRLQDRGGYHTWNLGTGRGHSVLEVIAAFERATGIAVPYEVAGGRPGDIAASYADPSRANEELGWRSDTSLETICADAWRWQQANPDGYPN
ncbi:MAG: UDP-glucose 4-epimerase GalE [Acidimicrobiia bacterium]|nr:UDP-glucose 4-epimerase GalE [Acidimicrobiia bacterium]